MHCSGSLDYHEVQKRDFAGQYNRTIATPHKSTKNKQVDIIHREQWVLTKDTEEGKVLKFFLGHDNAVLWEDSSENHHIHRTLVVADNDGGVLFQMLLSNNLEGHTTGIRSDEGKDPSDYKVGLMSPVEKRKDDGDKASDNRHDKGCNEDNTTLGHKLDLLRENSQESRQGQEEDRDGYDAPWNC